MLIGEKYDYNNRIYIYVQPENHDMGLSNLRMEDMSAKVVKGIDKMKE